MFRALALAVALAVATGAGKAVAAPPAAELPQEALGYRAALADMEARRFGPAIRQLSELAAQDPSNLGILLDLAIAHCLAGASDQSARLFLELEARPDLPPAIAEVIAYYRGGGCRPQPLGVQGFVSAGAGYARNFNYAPLNGLIWLPGLGLELALQDASRPRSAGFLQMDAGAVAALAGNEAWRVGLYAQAVQYREAPDYRLSTLQGSLNYRQHDMHRSIEAQVALARLWLGGTSHLDAALANGAALVPFTPQWSAGPSVSVQALRFRELSAFDARQLELRARAQWQASAVRVMLEAGWHHDEPASARPGGNRLGPIVQARAHWLADGSNGVDLTLRQTWLRDSDPYNTLLFGDLQRAPRQTSLQLAWRRALAASLNARAEYRYQKARDPIALFNYDTHSLSVAVEWVFSR